MRWLLAVVLLVSCGGAEETLVKEKTEVWVCHNRLSELHGSVCVEKVDVIRGAHQPCYWVNGERVKNSFCWLLRKEDCTDEFAVPQEFARTRLEWQEKYCPLIN